MDLSTESEEVAPGIVLDFDEHNRVVGIEIEDASKFISLMLKAFNQCQRLTELMSRL